MQQPKSDRAGARRGFTLIELLLSIALIAILATVMFTLTGGLRRRAEAAACMANMKTLFTALASYTTDNKHWPQPPESVLGNEEDFWNFWIKVLEPYGVSKETWMCPTYKRLTSDDEEGIMRTTYTPTGFGASSPSVPYRWNQPWLMEIGDHHGRGPLVLYPDGSIRPFAIRPKDEQN